MRLFTVTNLDQSKSELAAKDDSLETADASKDKDERMEEKKGEINEQGDQVILRSNQTLPLAFSQSQLMTLCSFLAGVWWKWSGPLPQ